MIRSSSLCTLLAAVLSAAEPAVDAPKPVMPDPTAAVVAEGRFIYRQRDLDALVLIAQRYSKQKLSRLEEDQLRQIVIAALIARETTLAALDHLPAALSGKARDQFTLDLLNYQAEKAPIKALVPTDPAPNPAAPAPVVSGPVLVRLPDLVLSRQIEGVGKRQLTLGLALSFADAAQNKAFEAKAAILQDAVLGYMHGIPGSESADPNQNTLKSGLTKAIQAKLPDFPGDAILIPQLEVTTPEAK